MALTERERITLLMMRGYGDRERSFREVRDLFNAEFRQGRQGISVATVLKTYNRFQDTGCVRGRVPLAHIPIAYIHSHRPVLRVFPLNHQSENFILN